MSVNENTNDLNGLDPSHLLNRAESKDDSLLLESLASRVGDFIKYWGFKRVHGQIWVHLFLTKEPLDAGELIRRLGVSKALISMSLSDLLSYDVILRAGKSSYGTQLYVANEEIVKVVVNVLMQRERKLILQTQAAQSSLDSLSPKAKATMKVDQERLDALGEMTRVAETLLDGVVRLGAVDCAPLRTLGKVGLRAVL